MIRKEQETTIDSEGVLNFKGTISVPRVDDLIQKLFAKSHGFRYSVHAGVTNMYLDLKRICWCPRMKKYREEFMFKCKNCKQVTYEHQRPMSLLQRMSILGCKCESIAMDFVVGLSKTCRKFDSI